MIKGIAHLCIRVADLGRTARFYCQGLGLEKAFDFRRDDKTVGFYLKAGNGNYLEFFEREPAEPGANPIDHLCFEVDSIDSVNAAVAAAGYTPGEKKMGADHAYQAWLTDPTASAIELHDTRPTAARKPARDLLSVNAPIQACARRTSPQRRASLP